MTVAATSRLAYQQLLDSGKITDRQEVAYSAIRELGVASDQEILAYLIETDPDGEWGINTVSARRHELFEFGVVRVAEIGKSRFNRSVKRWAVIDPAERQMRFLDE